MGSKVWIYFIIGKDLGDYYLYYSVLGCNLTKSLYLEDFPNIMQTLMLIIINVIRLNAFNIQALESSCLERMKLWF